MLGFFKGRLLVDFPAYSMGTRQSTATHAAENKWWSEHRIFIGEGEPDGEHRTYSDWLSSSTFCFAFRGGRVVLVAALQAAAPLGAMWFRVRASASPHAPVLCTGDGWSSRFEDAVLHGCAERWRGGQQRARGGW